MESNEDKVLRLETENKQLISDKWNLIVENANKDKEIRRLQTEVVEKLKKIKEDKNDPGFAETVFNFFNEKKQKKHDYSPYIIRNNNNLEKLNRKIILGIIFFIIAITSIIFGICL